MSVPGTNNTNNKKEWFHNLAFSLLLFLSFDFLAGRTYSQISFWIQNRQLLAVQIQSPVYHHDLKPNSHGRIGFGMVRPYDLFVNSLGFRDTEICEVPLSTSLYRMVFIGDSFTEGTFSSYPKSFVGIVKENLKGHQVDVLNAAVASYSPAIYYRKIKYLIETVGLKFDELVVFIDISDIKDETIYFLDRDLNVQSRHKEIMKLSTRRFVWKKMSNNSVLWRLIDTLKKQLQLNQKKYIINHLHSLWTVDPEAFETYGRKGLINAEKHMNLLLELLRANGIKLTISVYPWPDQIYRHDLDSKQVQFWEAWAKKNHVLFINHFPDFINEKNWREMLDEYFIPGDVHWNAKGHRLVAERFLKTFANQKTKR